VTEALAEALCPRQLFLVLDNCEHLLAASIQLIETLLHTCAQVPRQQTLRAAMDWSYGLLSAHERAVFRRRSVFADSFSLDAAEKRRVVTA
jgi:predicted ATPase